MDPISNMISSINNAIAVNKQHLFIPHSNTKTQILQKLRECGYIADFKVNKLKNNKKIIKIFLKYVNNKSVINSLKIISKPSLKIYTGYKKIPRVLGGIGNSIISTPKGIMTDKQARNKKLGGELICEVY